jgi:hypothetical protein
MSLIFNAGEHCRVGWLLEPATNESIAKTMRACKERSKLIRSTFSR